MWFGLVWFGETAEGQEGQMREEKAVRLAVDAFTEFRIQHNDNVKYNLGDDKMYTNWTFSLCSVSAILCSSKYEVRKSFLSWRARALGAHSIIGPYLICSNAKVLCSLSLFFSLVLATHNVE